MMTYDYRDRHKVAIDFDSKKELDYYLQKHPNADRAKHRVRPWYKKLEHATLGKSMDEVADETDQREEDDQRELRIRSKGDEAKLKKHFEGIDKRRKEERERAKKEAAGRVASGFGKHDLREDATGRFTSTDACDCCGKPTGADFFTDDEVCDGGDGPGFYLCGRKACIAKRQGLNVEQRRALYTVQRARNEELADQKDTVRLERLLARKGIGAQEAKALKAEGLTGAKLDDLIRSRRIRRFDSVEELRRQLDALPWRWRR